MLFGGLRRSYYTYKNITETNPILKKGAVVWCDLGFGVCEHTGVYLGNGLIMEFAGYKKGLIRPVDFKGFTRYGHFRSGTAIYAITDSKGNVLADETFADRAWRELLYPSKNRRYNLLTENCHMFTAGCITGDFDNGCIGFTLVEMEMQTYFSTLTSSRRVW
ncbi:hypothetical protein M3610_13460 [Neobacillus sp. MER 74]|uniref:hypothetical protein n=1 Tax=Neobacillus sp. MER 74 TaxID=2939566 RepID=UPI00203B9173|nr:hypothetical protein [Neobacillus sp. MER 74]MCM3116307.1 hypothetical protein [Neobacillus sp. MER 74]